MFTAMQKTIKSFMFVAAAAMGIVSCANEVSTNVDTNLVVRASVQELDNADEVKTYIGEAGGHANSIIWGKDEFLKIAVVNGENSVFATSTDDSKDLFDGETEALFAFDMKVGFDAPYTYCGIYPASVAVSNSNTNPAAYKVDLPAVQKATAASYDPAAYVMVVKPQSFEAVQTDLSASFRRATALNCITLKNLADDITSVEITATGKDLVGRRYFNLTTGESGEVYSNQSDKIDVNYETALAKAAEKKVWFTSWGVEIASGETLTVKASSATASYTRTITAKAEGIKFTEGCLNTLGIDMASAVVEEIKDYSGEYLIVSGEYLLTTFNSSANNYSYVKAEGPALNDFYKVSGIENYVWTVAKLADGSYSFCNKGTGKYLALTDDANQAHSADNADNKTARFNIKEESSVLYIYSCEYATRHLRYNSSSPRFAFYSSTTGSVATLLAYVADERTPFDPVSGLTWDSTGKTVSWTATEGATNGYEYTLDNGTTVKAASTNSIDCSSWSNGDYSVKVRVVATDTKKTSEWSTACGFTISGGAAAKYYTKVTEALEDWSGKYLIVSGTSAANGTINSKWLKCITVTVDPEKGILSDDSTNAVAVTIEPASTAGQYTIQFNGGNYLGTTNSNDGIKVDDTPGNGFYWTFSFADGLVKITNTIAANRHLRLNGDSGFRTYTGTTGTQATLYKLDEGPVAKVISVAVSGTPTKTTYKAGDEFETTGLIAKATFEDTSVKDVTDDAEWTVTPSPLTTGTTSVSVKASYKGVTSSAYVVNGLTVTEPATLSSISVKTAPTKVVYNEGEKFDPTGLVITRNYSDSSSDDYAYSGHESEFTFSPATSTALTTSNTSVTITYGGKSVNQTITVNEVAALSTMDAIFAAATTTEADAKIKFNNWVVSGVKGSNAYVTDGTKGLIIYTSGHGFVAGDILSGTVSCTLVKYNGSSELKGVTASTTGLTVTKGGTITPAEIAIADLSGVNTGAVITFESLQYNGTVFTDGVNTIKPYNAITDLPTLTSGRNYSVTGVYVQFNATKEIAPRTAADFVLLTTPYLSATADKTNVSAAGETVTITVDTNVEGWTVSSDNAAFTVGAKSGNTVPVTVSENTSTTDGRTAKITVSATGVSDVVITLTQAKKSAGGYDPGTVLFHETFGNNTGSARAWDDSYSVKSGIADVYSNISSYSVTNAKQGKNTTGSSGSGLNQSTSGTDAVLIIGPFSVSNCTDLQVTYYWKAGSVKGTYTAKLFYATSSTGEYTEVTGSGNGATTFVQRTFDLPSAAQVDNLYLKVVWNTSNTQAIIDEFELRIKP